MTGIPHTAPDEVPVVMGQGEYAPDADDHRVRRVGTPLRDASLDGEDGTGA